jgi:hypothetical protein
MHGSSCRSSRPPVSRRKGPRYVPDGDALGADDALGGADEALGATDALGGADEALGVPEALGATDGAADAEALDDVLGDTDVLGEAEALAEGEGECVGRGVGLGVSRPLPPSSTA